MADLVADLALSGLRQRAGEMRIEFDKDRHLVHMSIARDVNLVLRAEGRMAQQDFFDLRRKHIHPADDQHVVAAPGDLLHAPHRARRSRQQARQIARAIADDRQRLF